MAEPDDADRPGERFPVLRASDAEREVCVARLSTAAAEGRLTLEEFSERMHAAYAARTDAELAELLNDLPTSAEAPGTQPAVSGGPLRAVTGRKGTGASVAVMSGVTRKGVWSCSRVHTAVAVMGGIDIVVPEGWDVRVSGFALMGGTDERVRRDRVVPGAPSLHVRAYALMGGIDVVGKDASDRAPSRSELRESRETRQIEE